MMEESFGNVLVPVKIERGEEEEEKNTRVSVKREREEETGVFGVDFEAAGYELFKSYPEIPIREEHSKAKRIRCVCMEDSALFHIGNLLKQVDAAAGDIIVTDVTEFITKLRDHFKYEISLTSEEFDEKMRTLFLEIEEDKGKKSNSKKKKLGKTNQLQKLFKAQRQILNSLRALKGLVKNTRVRYGQLTERQIIVNNKLTQIRVKKSEGGVLQTTEWAAWSFLDEKQKKKK